MRRASESADAQAILDAIGAPSDAPTTVHAILTASQQAHQEWLAYALAPQIHRPPPPTPPQDPAAAQEHLVAAAQLRAYAHLLDPTQSDPAWTTETGTIYEHGPLLRFYRQRTV